MAISSRADGIVSAHFSGMNGTTVGTANVKGSKISSKLAFVEKHYGPQALQQLLGSLSSEDRASLANVIDLKWYPFELYDHVLRAIVSVNAKNDESVLDRIGAHSAEHQLNNIYSAYKREDLIRMFRNMVPMHAHMNDPGQMEVTIGGAAACTIIVTEPRSTASACRVSRAFYKRVAEMAGAKDVRVNETTCTSRGDDACRFEIYA
jgi:predicted hydrocarbon binding protein